jgi:hypothetical protein
VGLAAIDSALTLAAVVYSVVVRVWFC